MSLWDELHPGARVAIARLSMDELDVARAIAAGDLTSPQRYQNVSLFDIRITGTGRAYRRSLDEHVWRDASIYLNGRFLARCNGLPVIWQHPDKSVLDSDEFADRIVGTVFLPYIKGDDVWAVVKIWDDTAIEEMSRGELSTSPAVVLKDVESSKLTLSDDSVLLVEGRPTLLDHIAICSLGVWDKGGEPVGVRTDRQLVRADSERSTAVPKTEEEEKQEREDAARRDADAGQKLDKLLTHLDAMGDRFDKMEKRLDAMDEREDKARKDAEEEERKADARKRDEEHEEWEKADAAQCKMDDEEEEKEAKGYEEKGEAREVAADKARKSRRDRMDARRKDAEEKERKADAARSDSVDIDKRIADAIRVHTKQDTAEEREAKVEAQSRADAVYREFGDVHGAPPPMSGETSAGYRRRLLKGVQKHSADWKDVDLAALDGQTLPIAERRIYADAQVAARNPADLPDDRLITVKIRDPETGLLRTEFRGRHTFIHGMRRPSSRVTGVEARNAARVV